MIHTPSQSPPHERSKRPTGLLVLLCLCGLGLNGFLLWWKLAHPADTIAGCGGGGCGSVLGSRWSQVFGVPVTVPGTLVYVSLLFSLAMGWRRGQALCLAMLSGGALWFILVQALVLRHFCPWCMAAHAIGLAVAVLGLWRWRGEPGFPVFLVRPGLLAAVAVGLLAVSQIFGPAPAAHRLDAAAPGAAEDRSASILAAGRGRKVAFADGRMVFDVNALPHLGNPNATRVLVEYFDYQCDSCRVMRGYLDALLARHPQDLCLILLPVPLDESCNHRMKPGTPPHPGSCYLAKLALAVWRLAPPEFPALHEAFFADPAPSDPAALRLARQAVPGGRMEAAMKDLWIEQVLAADIADWEVMSQTSDHLPKLLIKDNRILHGLPASREDFLRVIEKELDF